MNALAASMLSAWQCRRDRSMLSNLNTLVVLVGDTDQAVESTVFEQVLSDTCSWHAAFSTR